jgi:hypothetical protein
MQEKWVVCKIFHKGIALGKGSHNINSNSYHIEEPVIDQQCHNPNMTSTNFDALTPLPNLQSLLPPASDGVNMGHVNHQQQLVQDATQWYNNMLTQLYDNRIISSDDATMGINWLAS